MPKSEQLIKLLPGEYWWGGRTADGRSMPYGLTLFKADLDENHHGNQACPLLISSKGRYLWSEEPFEFQFEPDYLTVAGKGDLITGEGYDSLRGAFGHVSRTFFPPAP